MKYKKGSKTMIHVSDPRTDSPQKYGNELQFLVYKTLNELHIPYQRVETDEVITMDDCAAINDVLNMKMVKTLFLCSRHRQDYYLYITGGKKRFNTKAFSTALSLSRVSFAPEEDMHEILGTKIGAATVFSTLLDTAKNVRIVFDPDVLREEHYGCSDGTTTGYLKLRTKDITDRLLPYTNHDYFIV